MNQAKFSDELKHLSKGSEVNSQQLWKALKGKNSSLHAHTFGCMLYELIIQQDKKNFVQQNNDRLLATLLCIAHYEDKQSQKLPEIKKKLLSQIESKSYGSGWLISSIFLKDLSEQDIIISLLDRFVFLPSKLECETGTIKEIEDKIKNSQIMLGKKKNSFKYYSYLEKISFPPIEPIMLKRLAFSYLCFHHFLQRSSITQTSLYDYIIGGLRVHINCLNRTHRSSIFLHCLLQLLSMLIKYYGCGEVSKIKELSACLALIRNQPSSFADLASNIMKMLHGEMKMFGETFRKQLRQDFPNIGKKQAESLGRETFVISRCEDFFSCGEHCSLTNLRKLVIMEVARSSGVLAWQKYIEVVGNLDSVSTFQLYKKMLDVVEYLGRIEQQYDQIRATSKVGVAQLLNSFNKPSQSISKKEKQQFDKLLQQQNQLGIFPYPCSQLTHVPLASFISLKLSGNFRSLLKKGLDQHHRGYFKNCLPLVFYGDDCEFAKVLEVISEYMAKTEIGQARRIKLYCLPKVDCHAGIPRYLASLDLWYRRFVYQPFNERLLYPYMEPCQSTRELLPAQLLRDTLQMYVREAQHTIPIQVYRIVLEGESRVESYFCNYIAVGSSAEAEILRQTKKMDKEKFRKYTDMDYIQLLTEKLPRVEELDLHLLMQEVCPLTKESKVVEERMKVEDLMVCNLPCDYFMGAKPQPGEPELEMSVLTPANGKAFRREVLRKDHFRGTAADRNDNFQAFRDLFISLQIKSLHIESMQPLKLVVDGVPYRNINSVSINPVVSINNLPVTLSVQSFTKS